MYSLRVGSGQRSYPILSGSYELGLNEAGRMQVDVFAQDIIGDRNNDFRVRESIKLFFNNQVLFSGFISKIPKVTVREGISVVSVSCISDLGRLALMESNVNAVFINRDFRLILAYLFEKTNFAINFRDEGNWPYANSLTIDLRSKENLLSQVNALFDYVPGMNYREIIGQNMIEMGFFLQSGFTRDYNLEFGGNLPRVDFERSHDDVMDGIYSWGGITKNPANQATLEYASTSASVTSHPLYSDFPIILDSDTQRYYVRNNSSVSFIKAYKTISYEDAKPPEEEDVDPVPAVSAGTKENASLSLYLKTVNDLLKSDQSISFSGEFVSTATHPYVGDKLYLNLGLREDVNPDQYIDVLGFAGTPLILKTINHEIGRFSQDEVNSDLLYFDFTASDREAVIVDYNELVNLYKAIQKPQDNKYEKDDKQLRLFTQVVTNTVVSEGLAADYRWDNLYGISENQSYFDSRIATVAIPTAPTWTVGRLFEGVALSEVYVGGGRDYSFKILTKPSWPSTDLEIAITPKNRNWGASPSSNATIVARWVFYEYAT